MSWWTSVLPADPAALSRLKWWLTVFLASWTIFAALVTAATGIVLYHVSALRETLLGPRHLSASQQAQLISLLKGESHEYRVSVVAAFASPEARAYGEELREALAAAGWPTSPRVTSNPVFGGHIVGLHVFIKSKESPAIQAAVRLVNTLRQTGLGARDGVNPDLAANQIELVVGHKPAD